jgi:hypothetical protein
MKTNELSQTLQTPNGHALRREIARAINYIESVSNAMKRPCDQAAELDAVLDEARAYMLKTNLITAKTKAAK